MNAVCWGDILNSTKMHLKIPLDCQVTFLQKLLSAVIGHRGKVAISIIAFTERVDRWPPCWQLLQTSVPGCLLISSQCTECDRAIGSKLNAELYWHTIMTSRHYHHHGYSMKMHTGPISSLLCWLTAAAEQCRNNSIAHQLILIKLQLHCRSILQMTSLGVTCIAAAV